MKSKERERSRKQAANERSLTWKRAAESATETGEIWVSNNERKSRRGRKKRDGILAKSKGKRRETGLEKRGNEVKRGTARERGREKMRRISEEQRQRDTKRKRENWRRSNSTQSKEKEEEVSNFNFSFTVNNLKILLFLFLLFMTFAKRKQFQLFFLNNHQTSLVKLSKQEQVLLVEFGSTHYLFGFVRTLWAARDCSSFASPRKGIFVLLLFTKLSNFTRKIAAVWFTPKYSRRQFHVLRWKRSLFKQLV